jgi:hypothetical protein
MRGLNFGDRRDRVNWGGLAYLAERFGIATILQVAYFREDSPTLTTDKSQRPIPPAVRHHFADLRRVEQLRYPLPVDIRVFDAPFDPANCDPYIRSVLRFAEILARPRLLFLDPDTGTEPGELKPEHAALADIEPLWSALCDDAILAMNQHGYRDSDWIHESMRRLSRVCCAAVHPITASPAADVSVLWARKGDSAEE